MGHGIIPRRYSIWDKATSLSPIPDKLIMQAAAAAAAASMVVGSSFFLQPMATMANKKQK